MRKPPSDRYIRFYGPILDVLRDLGGAAAPKEVKAAVLERVQIPDDEMSRQLKSGQNAVENEIAWARDGLRRLGLIDGAIHGVWRLTPDGAKTYLTLKEARALRDGVYQTFREKPDSFAKPESDLLNEEVDPPDSDGDLLAAIYALSPTGFEQLCKRVLREAGFYNVDVTKSGADGGIDGKGILQLNELVSFRVMFNASGTRTL